MNTFVAHIAGGPIARILLILASAVLVGSLIARGGLIVGLVLMALPLVAYFVYRIYDEPRLGLLFTIAAGFLGVGLRRYVPAPTGLLVDALLALTLVVVLLRRPEAWDWNRLKNGLFAVCLIWFLYNVFELFNPERPSITAWFYAVRGVALYLMLAAPLALLILDRRDDVDRVLRWWLILSVVGAFWGLKQLFVGLDGSEQAWLSVPGNQTTHLLFGKLRVFSFYSDTGQFGAAQGHAAVVAGVLALGPGSFRRRLLYALVAALSFYGLLISGTRGAMAVPLVGFVVFFILSKNWKVLLIGLAGIFLVFGLLKYTHVGHNIYEVRRMRSAVVEGMDNPSFQVRLENQKRLKAYLQSRPFGGGVGSAGYWGLRFSPDTFLANLALDSWYVKIWAEQGPVGLYLYLAILAYLFIATLRRVVRIRDPMLRQQMMALYAGLAGIAAASYGNQVLGQVPTGILVYLSLALLFLSPHFDTPEPPAITEAPD